MLNNCNIAFMIKKTFLSWFPDKKTKPFRVDCCAKPYLCHLSFGRNRIASIKLPFLLANGHVKTKEVHYQEIFFFFFC